MPWSRGAPVTVTVRRTHTSNSRQSGQRLPFLLSTGGAAPASGRSPSTGWVAVGGGGVGGEGVSATRSGSHASAHRLDVVYCFSRIADSSGTGP